MDSGMPGFKLTWHIENGSFPDVKDFVSKHLSGKVATPGLDSSSPPSYQQESHEYTAVIELPHNIEDLLADAALIVDIDVTIPKGQRNVGVELLTMQRKLKYYDISLNWTSAEAHCVSKGGHLVSFTSFGD